MWISPSAAAATAYAIGRCASRAEEPRKAAQCRVPCRGLHPRNHDGR